MPEPGCSARWSASQASRCSRGLELDDAEAQRLPVERAAQHQRLGAQLLGDVGGDPGVGGGGRGEHRDAVGQVAEQGADPAVVGTEVVAPVGDAVRLVDDQQPARGGQPRQHLVAETRVVEPLRAHQQHVDLAGRDRGVGLLPLLEVGGVDGHRADARALGRLRSGCASARAAATRSPSGRRPARAAAGWPRSRPPTCPSRCAAPPATAACRRPAPRSPSTGPPAGRRLLAPDQRAQVGLRLAAYVGRSGGGHACLSTSDHPTARARRP